MRIKILYKIGKLFAISFCIYAIISIALICWPIKLQENVKNYDYSSIKTQTHTDLGVEQWTKMRDNKEIFNRVYKVRVKTL